MRHHSFISPRETDIRVWRRIPSEQHPYSDWHVSVGAEAPLQALRQYVELASNFTGGMAWDEALEAVVFAMVTPGVLRTMMRHLEPPFGGGWDLVVQIVPLGAAEFHVQTVDRAWERLQVGEALAAFVSLTFPVDWRGFASERRASFALMEVAS